jgi:fatty-acyl-CoA synthase
MFIGDWMDRGERYYASNIAVFDTYKKQRLTFQQMNQRANAAAVFLRGLGVMRGDRVAILAMNCVEYLDLFFACAKLGAVYVPLNWRLHQEELASLLEDTEPKVVAFGEDFSQTVAALVGKCPRVEHWLHLEGPGIPESQGFFVGGLHGSAERVANEAVSEEDIACLLFTGGTTGKSKGAKISYRMIAWNTMNTVIHELQRGDVTITHTPMFHTGGLFVYTFPLLTLGGKVVITRKWDPEMILQIIEEERVSAFFATPTHYQQMLAAPSFTTRDLSSLRFLTSGGAPLPVTLIHDFQRVHDVPFKQGFGMTEFGPGIFSMAPEFSFTKAGSIGKPNYFIEANILDEDNQTVTADEIGELVVKGPSCFSGYFSLQGAAVQSGASAHHDEQGWFHTGDLARRDEDGFYYIVDRKKDMFISGGENVYPTEIEAIVYEHPCVAQCAVIGVPDEKWGEVGCVFIVQRPSQAASAEEILLFLRERLARYKVPKRVIFIDALPVSAAGKILKRELRLQA